MNIQNIKGIISFEPTRNLRNPLIIIAIVFILVWFLWICLYLIDNAETIIRVVNQSGGRTELFIFAILKKVLDESVSNLLTNHSPLLGTFFFFSLLITPMFGILFSSDQTASDIGRKHIRFLLPRVNRISLYLSRILSTWIAWSIIVLLMTLIVTLVIGLSRTTDLTGPLILFGLRIALTLSIYGLPFIAMMAFANSFTSSAAIALLLGWAFWIITTLLTWIGGAFGDEYEYIQFIFPSSVKYYMLSDDITVVLGSIGLTLLYSLVFTALGWLIITKRDL
ncbi:MAG TPA: hypothetical protein ENI73_07240 [Spirochaetes bacterium]|nr:hypothetical protein [Spirochaetota bacterium]